MHAFGDWFAGGEVVAELIPFPDRQYRVDFALPRWRVYVEVDGWQFHGANLDDHHADRERALLFSRHDWLPFRLSHQQAIKQTPVLVDAIRDAIKIRQAMPREMIRIERIITAKSTRARLHQISK